MRNPCDYYRCDECGEENTRLYDAEPLTNVPGSQFCRYCVESSMEYGHRHVHDEPEDCRLRLGLVVGYPLGTETFDCPKPTKRTWEVRRTVTYALLIEAETEDEAAEEARGVLMADWDVVDRGFYDVYPHSGEVRS